MSTYKSVINPIRYNLLCLLVVCTFCSFSADAFRIGGKTINKDGSTAAVGVMVKAKHKGRIVQFTRSDHNGAFSLEVPDSIRNSGVIEFSSSRYETLTIPAKNFGKDENINLMPQAKELAEVVVRPQTVRQRGDTISYSVDAIKNVADRTIEDVISHLPGIRINNGTIYYNGKPINRFYVEGLDGLGSQYSMATQNIRAEDVNTVDVMENHEPVRAKKEVSMSESAGINIKLKKRAMLKPSGHVAGGIGKIGDDVAWMGKFYLMLISPKMQIYSDTRGNNFGQPSGNSESMPFGTMLPNVNSLRLSSVGAGLDIPTTLYQQSRKAGSAANYAMKLGEYATLRGWVNYGFSRYESRGMRLTVYPLADGGDELRIVENGHSVSRSQTASLFSTYEYNAPKLYVRNNLGAGVRFNRGNASIMADPGESVDQCLRKNDVVVNDNLSIISKRGGRLWEGSMSLNYHNVPLNSLHANDILTEENVVSQSVRAEGFTFDAKTDFSWSLGGPSMLGLTLDATEKYTKVNTIGYQGSSMELTGINIPRGNEAVVSAGPFYRLVLPAWRIEAGVPLEMVMQNFTRLSNLEDYNYFGLNPSPYLKVSLFLPNEIKGRLGASFSRTRSGFSEFITAPIATDFRSTIIPGIGNPTATTFWTANTGWEWKSVLTGFFVSLRFIYDGSVNNRMISTDISDTDISTSYVKERNRSDHYSTALSISQLMMGQKATLKFDGSYTTGKSSMCRNGTIYGVDNSMVSANVSFTAPLLNDRLVIKPDVGVNHSWQKSGDYFSGHFTRWSANLPITCLVFRGFDITVNPEFRSNPLTDGQRLNSFLLGANVRYVKRKWELELTLKNITDRKAFAMESYSNLIYTSSRVALTGIQGLITLRYNF